jgi:hypothetical protein
MRHPMSLKGVFAQPLKKVQSRNSPKLHLWWGPSQPSLIIQFSDFDFTISTSGDGGFCIKPRKGIFQQKLLW